MSGKKHVLEIVGEPISSGGQESFIANVFEHINMDGIKMDWLTLYECDNDQYRHIVESKGGKLISLGFTFVPGKFRMDYMNALTCYLKNNMYDVVHIHSGSSTILSFVSLSAKISGVKKIIVHSHSTGYSKGIKYRLMKSFTFPFLRFLPDCYCSCSQAAGKWRYPSSVSHKIMVIKNGIDLNVFSPKEEVRENVRREIGIDDKTMIVGHVGRFSFVKNHPFITQLYINLKEKVPNSKLMLVGDGELFESVKETIKQNKIEKDVILVGRVPNVCDYMQAMDVILLPSLWEGLPIVGVEAQGIGVPMIASTNVSLDMKLTDAVSYLDLDDMDKWVEKIVEMSQKRYPMNASILREKGYDINQTAEKLRELYLS